MAVARRQPSHPLVAYRMTLEQFEKLELSVQESSMSAGHTGTADAAPHNGLGEADLSSRDGGASRPDSAEDDSTASEGEARRPAERQPGVAVGPHRGEHAPTTRIGKFSRSIREWLWFIAFVAVVSVGLAMGFALVAPPEQGATVLVLVAGSLVAGLVFGVGAALVLEYVAVRRSRGRSQRRSNPPSTAHKPPDDESSESSR